MKELIKNKLYSFDEKVRVELGPQIIELDCNDKNLSNDVTHDNYQKGKIDAFGKVIGEHKKMSCVDWKAKRAPLLWKVYQMQETDTVDRFIKINEFEDKAEAFTFAESVFKEMN